MARQAHRRDRRVEKLRHEQCAMNSQRQHQNGAALAHRRDGRVEKLRHEQCARRRRLRVRPQHKHLFFQSPGRVELEHHVGERRDGVRRQVEALHFEELGGVLGAEGEVGEGGGEEQGIAVARAAGRIARGAVVLTCRPEWGKLSWGAHQWGRTLLTSSVTC